MKKRLILYVLFTTMLLLAKETAALVLLAMFIHFFVNILIKNKKIKLRDIEDGFFITVPLIPLLLWFLYLQITESWMFRTDLIINKYDFINILILNLLRYFVYDLTLTNANKYNFIISIFIICSLIKIKKMEIKSVYFLFILIILLHTILFSYTVDLPRYFTPILPFYYLIGAHSIYFIFGRLRHKNYFYFSMIALLVVLFISNYTGTRQAPIELLQSNLEYLDVLQTHKEAAKYIEKNYPNSTILTSWPMTEEISIDFLGYISKKMDFITVHNSLDKDFKIYEKNVIVYYSPQSVNPNLLDSLNKENLILIKRFEKNNKYAEIYQLSNER